MTTIRNTVTLVGHLGRDPEMRTFENGRKLVRFSLATNEMWRNEKGETMKETQWHNIVGWGKTAELMQERLVKGKEVIVKGKLTYNNYTDKNGVNRVNPEVVVSEFLLVSNPAPVAAPAPADAQ